MGLFRRKGSEKSRFTVHEQIMRLVIVAMLSALGYLLMFLGKFLPYPPVPFLEIEISDAVVLVGYSLYGFWASFAIAIIKTGLQLLTTGPVGSPIPIGQITALITSLTYALLLLILDKGFKIFSKNRWFRYLGYVLITLFVSFFLTFLNWLFITPTYLVYGAEFLSYFQIRDDLLNNGQYAETLHSYFSAFNFGYTGIIAAVYLPFNLLKGALVCLVYELLFNRVIFHMLKSGRFESKIFMNASDLKEKEKKERYKDYSNLLDGVEIEKKTYQYLLLITYQNKQLILPIIESEKEKELFVEEYVHKNYPNTSYQVLKESKIKNKVEDSESENLSKEEFFNQYNCDKLITTTYQIELNIV